MKEERFKEVIDWIIELQRQKPEHSSECQIAINILKGGRPSIEEKYNKLLSTLDRTYFQLQDERELWLKKSKESKLWRSRLYFKTVAKAIARVCNKLEWMRARNSDMVKLLSK